MNNNNIDTNPCGPISEADKLRIFAAYASDDLARLHAEFGFPESQPIDVDDMIAALRLARPSPAPVKSVGEDATRAINGILRVVDADKTGDLHLLLGDDIETLTNCIDSLLAARTVADAPDWNAVQVCTWIGNQLMNQPGMFERGEVCKFVRSLGRDERLVKHFATPAAALDLPLHHDPISVDAYNKGFEAGLAAKVADAPAEPAAYLVDWADIGEGTGQSMFYGQDAKKHMESAVSYAKHARNRPSTVTPLFAAPVAADQPAHDVSVRDAERFQFMMDWQEHNDQPEEILVMWRKVYAENRVKPTRAEYEAAIDEAIRALRSQPAKQQGDSNE